MIKPFHLLFENCVIIEKNHHIPVQILLGESARKNIFISYEEFLHFNMNSPWVIYSLRVKDIHEMIFLNFTNSI